MGVSCLVAAPSLIPKKPGERIKTDRRDAKNLARLLRSGDLTKVWVPDERQEALRDLVRAREDAVEDVRRKRNQIGKFLLRLEVKQPEGVKPWGVKYRQWLSSLHFNQAVQEVVLREYLHAVEESEAMSDRLEKEIEEQGKSNDLAPLIESLQVLRGVGVITAATVVAEAGDLTRFDSPRQLMSYAGLVPSEYSSGGTRHLGKITKSGNAHIRRVLLESAWHYRRTPAVGAPLRKRGFRRHTRPRVSGGMLQRPVRTISWSLARVRGRVVIRMAVPSSLKEQCKALKLGHVLGVLQELETFLGTIDITGFENIVSSHQWREMASIQFKAKNLEREFKRLEQVYAS